MIRPWMKWLSEYQSVSCCEFSADCTMPCHSLTVPQVQIGTRPMVSSIAAAETTIASVANAARECGISVRPPLRLIPRFPHPSPLDAATLRDWQAARLHARPQPLRHPAMSRHDCDVAIVGGGLAGGLIALALAEARPEVSVRLIEAGAAPGGNR